MNEIKNIKILGLKFSLIDKIKLIELLKQNIKKKIKTFVTFRDTSSLMLIRNDNKLLKIQNNEVTISIADGWPIELAARLNNISLKRIPGPDFFKSFIKIEMKLNHYFIGSSIDNLNYLKKKLENIKNINIVGIESPIFDELQENDFKRIAYSIKKNKAQVIWLAISSPKQELFISKLINLAPATYFAVGAAIDFYTGKQKRAPKLLRIIYLEWLFRLVNSPLRLGYRYLILAPKFFYLIFKENFLNKFKF